MLDLIMMIEISFAVYFMMLGTVAWEDLRFNRDLYLLRA